MVVMGGYRDDSLGDDGSGVVVLVHEMHSRPGEPDTRGNHSLVHPAAIKAFAAESREESRMDVEHRSWERCNNFLGDQLHRQRISKLDEGRAGRSTGSCVRAACLA